MKNKLQNILNSGANSEDGLKRSLLSGCGLSRLNDDTCVTKHYISAEMKPKVAHI